MIRLKLVDGNPDKAPCGTLAVGMFTGERPPKGEAGWVDWRLGGAISRAILAGKMDGAAGTFVLIPAKKLPCQRVLVVGLGPHAQFKSKDLANALDAVLEKTAGFHDTDLGIAIPGTKPFALPRNTAEVIGDRILHALAASARSATITVLGPADVLGDLKEWVRTQQDPVASHVALDEDVRSHSGEAREGA